MKKWLTLLAILALFLAAALGTLAAMTGPLYTPGSVAALPAASLTPPVQTRPEVWTVAEGVELAYRAQGSGRPVLVVHGGPAIPVQRPWAALDGLADRFRFYYYDQRGCGGSTRPLDRFAGGGFYDNMLHLEAQLGLGAQIADIERIRRILDAERLLLIGHSFGGFLATLYAAEFPERVERLVLVAPAGLWTTPDRDRDLFAQTQARLSGRERQDFMDLRTHYFDFQGHFARSEGELARLHLEVGAYLLEAMGYPRTEPAVPPAGVLPAAGGWSVFACFFSMGKDWDFRAALPRVQARTTILIGADDDLSQAGAESYAAIRDAQVLVLRREVGDRPVRHMPFVECPRHFAKGVRRGLGAK